MTRATSESKRVCSAVRNTLLQSPGSTGQKELNAVGDIDECLITTAPKTNPEATVTDAADPVFARPVRVNKFLAEVDRDIPGFNYQYGLLSEYARPNWAGTVLIYAKHDFETRLTDFGKNMRCGDNAKVIGVGNLCVALMICEAKYNDIGDLGPAFIPHASNT
jgi:hypothetical protein